MAPICGNFSFYQILANVRTEEFGVDWKLWLQIDTCHIVLEVLCRHLLMDTNIYPFSRKQAKWQNEIRRPFCNRVAVLYFEGCSLEVVLLIDGTTFCSSSRHDWMLNLLLCSESRCFLFLLVCLSSWKIKLRQEMRLSASWTLPPLTSFSGSLWQVASNSYLKHTYIQNLNVFHTI